MGDHLWLFHAAFNEKEEKNEKYDFGIKNKWSILRSA